MFRKKPSQAGDDSKRSDAVIHEVYFLKQLPPNSTHDAPEDVEIVVKRPLKEQHPLSKTAASY